jgi:PTS system nitrogen regulatory IIA component
MAELAEAYTEAGRWRNRPPDVIVRGHRHRHIEIRVPTALGYGIAIPHGRIKGLGDTACAFIRLKTPIDFDAPDSLPVDLLFILLAPEAATDLHLRILGELAQLFSEKDMRDRLRAAADADALFRLLHDWDPRA